MTKQEFLHQLNHALRRIRAEERRQQLSYYEEMIDDRMEAGLCQADAVAQIGDPNAIAAEILSDGANCKKPLSAAKIALIVMLVLGSPVWGSLLLAAICVILSAYIVLWCIPIVTGSVCLGSFLVTVWGIAGLFPLLAESTALAVVQLGISVLAIGTGLLFGLLTIWMVRIFCVLTARFTRWLIRLFYKKEALA